jgi:FAD/FMN-containing dehydrogenase
MAMSMIQALRNAGVTRVLDPSDPGYASETSGFDLGLACLPDLVVAVQAPADVAAAVAVASERGERLTVLGSGHGRLHEVRGGVAISMRALADVEVDAGGRSARIGAGATWEPVLAATAPHGLAALCGSAPAVGVAGYLLGGGLGPLARTYGFSADHVQAVEVVTPADGSLTVTAESAPDLFWALRGGKGGLGVVTAVTIGLLPLTQVYGGALYFEAADLPAVLAAYAEWSPALPESTTASIALLRLPEADAVPEAVRGKKVAHVRLASTDAPASAERQLAAIRAVAPPSLDTTGMLRYDRIGTIHGDPVTPMPVANGSATLAALDTGTVAALLATAGPQTDAPLSSVEIRTLGRAAARQAPVPNAVGGRSAAHLLNVYAAPDPALSDIERLAAVRAVLDAVAQWRGPIELINFVGRANGADAVLRSWSPDQNDRLDAIRGRRDPAGMLPFGRHGK